MSEPKFSKGPWAMLPEECDKPYIRVRETILGGRYKIYNVVTPVHEGVHAREAIETRANAALITAAPEMYYLLAELLEKECAGTPTAITINALLAKARGDAA